MDEQKYTKMNVAIIPARGGSKGIKYKNIKLLCGRPLLYYTLDAALYSDKFERIIVSSEDDEILGVAEDYGAGLEMRKRPEEYAQDHVHSIWAVLDCIGQYDFENEDTVCMLLPTSPFRTEDDIIGALELFDCSECNSVVSVAKATIPKSLGVNRRANSAVVRKTKAFPRPNDA